MNYYAIKPLLFSVLILISTYSQLKSQSNQTQAIARSSNTLSKETPGPFSEYEAQQDSSTQFPITTQIKANKNGGKFMLGEHYRSVYLQQYTFPVLDMATYKGGFDILKKGGGKQTNSLRMITPKGKEYVLRSMTKDVSRTVPSPFNKIPLVNNLFTDTFLGTFPFAPLVIPTLADAVNVYHANPEIFYVPKQPTLGKYNDVFGGEVYLLEERANKQWPELASFGNAVKFSSSSNLLEKLQKNNKHHIDQNWVARSRIFDVLIGDWDRHEDQWRWAVTEMDNKHKLYRPIPRDRDQAFSKYDGFAIKALSPYHLFLRQISDYDDKLNNFKWNTYNSRHFDNRFLNELSLEEWKKEAAYIEEHLTDKVIEAAFQKLPTKAYNMNAEEIIRVLKLRRDKLQLIAAGMYGQLSKKVSIVGTHKKDYFEIFRKEHGITEINRYSINSAGEKKNRYYHRIFKDSETQSVFIYGLDDNDIFHISGKANKGLEIHMMGASGEDQYLDESSVSGMGKKHKIHESNKGNILDIGSESKHIKKNVPEDYQYDSRGKQNDENISFALPKVGYNSDDGIFIGASGFSTVTAFNKSPYAQSHKLDINYAFATQAFSVGYNGEFIQVAKNWDLVVNGELRGNRYAFNFFGMGNESRKEVDDINFYRVQQSLGYIDVGIQRRFASDLGRFSIRPSLQRNEIANTHNRFIDGEETGLDGTHLENRLYGGLVSTISLSKVDNEVSPRKGYSFNSALNFKKSLTGSSRQFATFGTDLTVYASTGNPRKPITLASRVGAEFIRGDYDFFFAPTLGQKQNLRGYARDRFRGGSLFYHTTDLRIPLGSSLNFLLPMSFGISAAFDYGRVWEPGEDSSIWHSNYGGGIWFAPLNKIVVSINAYRSNESTMIAVQLNHSF